jgi:hypothetical protein
MNKRSILKFGIMQDTAFTRISLLAFIRYIPCTPS